MQLEPGEGETLDKLAGDWRILQLRRGHRFSTDDLVLGWRAALAAPGARRLLDLGCGIGSVGLSALWRIGAEDATLQGIEAQAISVGLARRTVRVNGLEERVRIHHADLRDEAPVGVAHGAFDLVTGSPPYIPEGKGVLSPVPQRAAARIELRGSIFDYCAAARRYIAPGGRFGFVMAAADPRTEEAPAQAGFTVVERWDIVFRAGREPHIAVLICGLSSDALPARVEHRLVVRGEDGEFTDAYLQFRGDMGSPMSRRPMS